MLVLGVETCTERNREFRNTLKAIYEYNFNKTDSLLSALSSLKPVCANFQFLYAFLKGSYLVDLYAKGLRTSNDIDILINLKDITELTAKLKAAGFNQEQKEYLNELLKKEYNSIWEDILQCF